MVMKPSAEARHLGGPEFQLAKGTRRIFINEHWCDMREDDLRYADESFYEPLLETALREGQEEIGLEDRNVAKMFDAGGFSFVSVSRNVRKPLHMFAALVKDAQDFGPYEPTTAETRWLTQEEFAQAGRDDHILILNEICTLLQPWLREST